MREFSAVEHAGHRRRDLGSHGAVAVDEVREPGEDDAARHALRQRLAERDAAIGRLARLLRPLLCRQPQRRAVAEAARDAVDRRALVLDQGQERGPCSGHARRDGRLEGDGLALPGDAPERVQRQVVAASERHGHAGESTEAMSFGASAGLGFRHARVEG